MIPKSLLIAAVGLSLVLPAAAARADTAFADAFRALLYDGKTDTAVDLAADTAADLPGDPQVQFALGAAQFLLAVERMGQGLYRYGLASEYELGMAAGLTGMPFLRLPVPLNPEPEPVTYQALRGVLERFVTDLAVADTTLVEVGPEPFDLSLDLMQVRLDFDQDGQVSESDSLMHAFAAVSGGRRAIAGVDGSADFSIDFDQSDAPWLQGYCNLLMAVASFPLAHDWEPAFQATFHDLFPGSTLASSGLSEETRRLIETVDQFRAADGSFPQYMNKPADVEWKDWVQTPEYRRYQDFARARTAMEFGSIADLVAFVHLFNWPVVEPARMNDVRRHLLAMIDRSRENWRRIRAETDDKREWLPAPGQTGVAARLRVTEDRVEGWQRFLDLSDAVLNGEKLVPHWRFGGGKGVNIRRIFEEPTTFDPILIAQGAAVLPYLEEGEVVQEDVVAEIGDLIGRGFLAYFVWFN